MNSELAATVYRELVSGTYRWNRRRAASLDGCPPCGAVKPCAMASQDRPAVRASRTALRSASGFACSRAPSSSLASRRWNRRTTCFGGFRDSPRRTSSAATTDSFHNARRFHRRSVGLGNCPRAAMALIVDAGMSLLPVTAASRAAISAAVTYPEGGSEPRISLVVAVMTKRASRAHGTDCEMLAPSALGCQVQRIVTIR